MKLWKTTKDETGNSYGRLTVVGHSGKSSRSRSAMWDCLCKCGGRSVVSGKNLRSGAVAACQACSRRRYDRLSKDMPEYTSWRAMKKRCKYKSGYADRGIAVCGRWQNSFAAFYEDMGRKPSTRHTLERVNNNEGYGPDNCIWALPKQQSSNRRCTVTLSLSGVTMTLTDWSSHSGICRATIDSRLLAGWDTKKALCTPPEPKGSRSHPRQEPSKFFTALIESDLPLLAGALGLESEPSLEPEVSSFMDADDSQADF